MEWIKRAKSAYIAVSVIMVILGAVLMLNPGLSMLTLCYLIGGLMVIFGITRLVGSNLIWHSESSVCSRAL